MNNIRKFAALVLMAGVCAAPLAFMSDSAQAQNYPKAGQYYPKAGNYPRAAGKSAPQASSTQSSSVQNSADDSTVSTSKSAVRVKKAGAKSEDKAYYDRYQKTMEAWKTVESEIKGGQRDISTYDSEVLKRNHRNVAVLWCMIHKDYGKTVKRVSDGRTTIENNTTADIKDWMNSLRYLVSAFEEELKSRGLEFDSYETIKKEQGIKG
ncbi:TPA: hypothetical protein DD394_05515 [bacterium UBP9_UBA11836]|nr:hypothetical protein [bacterium UBP9_UBA11836]